MRRLLAAGGALALLLAAVLATGAATGSVESVVASLGNDYFLIAAVGGVATLAAIVAALSGSAETLNQAETPEPEGPVVVPTAGEPFDEQLSTWTLRLPVVGAEQRAQVRERLRTAATGSLRRVEGCSRATARERVESGDWTDEPRVAAFLSPDDRWLGETVRAPRLARRTATAIGELDDDDTERGDGA